MSIISLDCPQTGLTTNWIDFDRQAGFVYWLTTSAMETAAATAAAALSVVNVRDYLTAQGELLAASREAEKSLFGLKSRVIAHLHWVAEVEAVRVRTIAPVSVTVNVKPYRHW